MGDIGTRGETNHVTPVLEGTAELGGIYSKTEWLVVRGSNVYIRILSYRGTNLPSTIGEKGEVIKNCLRNGASSKA